MDRDGRAGRALRTFLVIAVTAAVVAPVAAFASNQFTDVSSDHTFHDDITWLADSEVTKGCNPPENTRFCPGDDVTRAQMAAFLHRLATNQVVDAGTLDGLDSEDFALSGQACASGDVVTGVAADGTVTCAADGTNGGDADTLDGMDSTDFQRSGCARGTVMAFGLVDESMLTDVNMGTAGVTDHFTCNGTDVTASDGATGVVEIHIGDSAALGPTGEFSCPPQIAHITLDHETGAGEAVAQTVLVDTGGVAPECRLVVRTYDSAGTPADRDFHFTVVEYS